MFLKGNVNVIPLRYYTETASAAQIGASSGGSSYSNGGVTGRRFTSSGNLVISVGGSFQALSVGVGEQGLRGSSGDQYGTDADGTGGAGGIVSLIYCTLNVGSYTITLPTSPGLPVSFTPTTTVNTVNYPPGNGGYGSFGDFTGVGNGVNGDNGPSLPFPFNIVSVSGGGGGGGGPNYGGPAVGGTGGTYAFSGSPVNAASTSYGSGGGGGLRNGTVGGLGGPALFVIFPGGGGGISDISETTRLNNMLINTNYTLTDLLDNYYSIFYNPNTTLYTVPSIPNIATLANRYTVNGTSITTSLVSKKNPFIVTGSSSYSVNYFNGHYTMILTTNGTYTITFSTAINNMVAYVCSAGGNGGGGDYSGGGGDGGGGGSGVVARANISLPIGAVLTCSLNTSGYYRVTYAANNSYISATNGTNGGNSPGATNGTQGTNGTANLIGTSFINLVQSNGATLTNLGFGTTAAGYIMHINSDSAIGFGGWGIIGGPGGKNGVNGGNPLSRDGVGYGAGGGGEVSFEGGPGTGAPGVIILSIPSA